MCFLPVKCLKCIIFIGSICSIAISIGLLALTIYVQVEKKDIISAANQGAVTGSLIALYISSIIFLLLGVAGLTGSMKGMSKKEDKGTFLLFLFSIGITVFFAVFLAGTIFFFVGPEAIFGTDCTSGSKTTLINQLYATSQDAYKNFCTDTCPCYIENQQSDLAKALSTTLNNNTANPDGKTKYGDCTNVQSSQEGIDILSALQNLLQCGGWCPLNNNKEGNGTLLFTYYRFRNINECTDEKCLAELNSKNCHDAFSDFMTGNGRIVGFGCLVAMLVCFLNLIAVCCICCHPSKSGRSTSNFYSRMIQIE